MTGILKEGLDGNALPDTSNGTSDIDNAATSEVSGGMQKRVNLVIAAKPGVELRPQYADKVRTNLDLFSTGHAPDWCFTQSADSNTIGVMSVPLEQKAFATNMIQVWEGIAIVE